jgi:hypothetical protein
MYKIRSDHRSSMIAMPVLLSALLLHRFFYF